MGHVRLAVIGAYPSKPVGAGGRSRSPKVRSPSHPGGRSITDVSGSGVHHPGKNLLNLCLNQPLHGEAAFVRKGFRIQGSSSSIATIDSAVQEKLLNIWVSDLQITCSSSDVALEPARINRTGWRAYGCRAQRLF